MNRETWLNLLAQKMAPRFEQMGFPLPNFRVAVGFGGRGQRSNSAAECWNSSVSADKHFEILIMPDQVEPNEVACHLAHELTHAAVGFDCGHTGSFAKVCLALGLKRPMTATTPGPAFIEWVAPMLAELGPMPHAKLMFNRGAGTEQKEGGQEGGDDGEREPMVGGRSSAPKKQTTRLKKCVCEECGYTVRITQKWLEVGAPHCPVHGAMKIDGDGDD